MFLGLLVLFTALTISSVAIYYSVAGLVAIFAAAAVPIIIMGTALEVAKLVTTVWLHKYWETAVWWLRTYLSMAVVVLMLITSMGIFGYLSKAHIEQTAQSEQSLKEVEQIDIEIKRQTLLVEKLEKDTEALESQGSNKDAGIQAQIDTEQKRIDTAYTRIQPALDEQNAVIARAEDEIKSRTATFDNQLSDVESKLSALASALTANDVKAAQAILGIKQDGDLGPATTRAINDYRTSLETKRDELLNRIETIRTEPNPKIDAAKAEMQRLRSLAEKEISDSNALINRLRSQIGTTDVTANADAIEKNRTRIAEINKTIDELSQKKFDLETQYRKLEAEVGPIKYIAEFIYGDNADSSMLEHAVRWVIVLIIFVFDPLAVLLLIASQYTLAGIKPKKIPEPEPPEPPVVKKTRSKKPQPKKTALPKATVQRPTRKPRVKAEPKTVQPEQVPELINDEVARAAILAETEQLDSWKSAKKRWKDENPELNLKAFKDDYVRGKIDELPWAVYVEDGQYVQNSEQASSTLWNKIKERTNGSDNSNNSPGQTV